MLNFSLPRLPFREDKLFGILVLILLSVPLIFYWGTYEKYETIKVFLFLLLSGVALLTWSKKSEIPNLPKTKIFWALFLGFVASFILSLAFTQDWVTSIFGSYLRFTNGLVFFLAWAVLLVLFMIQARIPEKRNFFFKVIFFDSFAIALVSVLQSFGFGYYEGLNMPVISRAPGLLGNPNFTTMFLAATVCLAVPLFFAAEHFAGRLYYALGGAFALWAIVMLSSRGSWLGLGVVVAVSLALSSIIKFSGKVKLAFLAVGVLACIFWLAFYQLTPRQNLIASTVSLKDENVNSRLLAWELSFRAMLDKPIFGFGPGNFTLAYEKFRSPELKSLGIFDDPHNLFLQQAVTLGLPALLLLLGLLFWAGKQGVKILASTKDIYLIPVLAGFASLLVMACFNPFTAPNWLLLALFLGILTSCGSKEYEEVLALKALPKTRAALAILGLGLILVSVLFFCGEVLYYQGAKAYNAGDFVRARTFFDWTNKINPYQELNPMYLSATSIRLKESNQVIQRNIEKIATLHPKRSTAYALESNLYYYWYIFDRQPEYLDTAITRMEKAVAMDPYFGRRYGRLGYYYLLKNNPQKAEEYMKLGLGAEPAYLPGWLLLAKAYQVENKRTEVVKCLEQAFKLRPDLLELKYLLKTAEEIKDIRQLIIPGGISPDILE